MNNAQDWHSDAMKQVMEAVFKFAPTNLNLLLIGDTGAGGLVRHRPNLIGSNHKGCPYNRRVESVSISSRAIVLWWNVWLFRFGIRRFLSSESFQPTGELNSPIAVSISSHGTIIALNHWQFPFRFLPEWCGGGDNYVRSIGYFDRYGYFCFSDFFCYLALS